MFYTFNQNNSGGFFVFTDELAHFVIIEAKTAASANKKAKSIGIYFDGCDSGEDCRCCGDRWYPADKSDGEKTPMIYARSPAEYECAWTPNGKPKCIVYYADGKVKRFLNR